MRGSSARERSGMEQREGPPVLRGHLLSSTVDIRPSLGALGEQAAQKVL